MEHSSQLGLLTFGQFTLDVGSGELHCADGLVRLQPQPLKLLVLLACRTGQLVSRAEIRQHLWGADTIVDFDNAISFCIRSIRKALSEDADSPVLIETLPRRGYRFKAPAKFCSSDDPIGATEGCIDNRARGLGAPIPAADSAARNNSRVQITIDGMILRSDEQVHITAQLGIAPAGVSYDIDETPAHQAHLARQFAQKGRVSLEVLQPGRHQTRVHTFPARSAAHQSYVMGKYHWNKRTEACLRKALECFQQAVDDDPRYAPAYAGIADCCLILAQSGPLPPKRSYLRARAAAAKAIELDADLAEAHASFGYAKMISEWEWQAAEQEFLKAIQLDGSCAIAHQWYADYLTATARYDEALAEIQRAWELDPLSVNITADVAWTLSYARRYDDAIEQYLRTLEMEPSFLPAHWGLGLTYLQKSMFKEAVSELEKSVSLSQGSPMMSAALACGYARSGKKTKAQQVLGELRRMSARRYVPAYDVATVYIGLGDDSKAFAWLDKALSEHSAYLVFVRSDPRLDVEGANLKFRAIASQLGLTTSRTG